MKTIIITQILMIALSSANAANLSPLDDPRLVKGANTVLATYGDQAFGTPTALRLILSGLRLKRRAIQESKRIPLHKNSQKLKDLLSQLNFVIEPAVNIDVQFLNKLHDQALAADIANFANWLNILISHLGGGLIGSPDILEFICRLVSLAPAALCVAPTNFSEISPLEFLIWNSLPVRKNKINDLLLKRFGFYIESHRQTEHVYHVLTKMASDYDINNWYELDHEICFILDTMSKEALPVFLKSGNNYSEWFIYSRAAIQLMIYDSATILETIKQLPVENCIELFNHVLCRLEQMCKNDLPKFKGTKCRAADFPQLLAATELLCQLREGMSEESCQKCISSLKDSRNRVENNSKRFYLEFVWFLTHESGYSIDPAFTVLTPRTSSDRTLARAMINRLLVVISSGLRCGPAGWCPESPLAKKPKHCQWICDIYRNTEDELSRHC